MANKTILVTGSTGWLGGKLCEALVSRGVKVVGLARRDTEVAGVLSVRADLATGAGLEKLKGYEFDCCVHLAAVAGWGALADCLEVNVQGTQRLFDALAGACTRFVVASSISTVGTGFVTGRRVRGFPPQQLPMPDTHPYVGYPWAYALSKWQMEQLVQFIATQNDCENPPYGAPDAHSGAAAIILRRDEADQLLHLPLREGVCPRVADVRMSIRHWQSLWREILYWVK